MEILLLEDYFAGRFCHHPVNYNTIEYITYASTGDAIDFGDTVATGRYGGGNIKCHKVHCLATGMNPGNTNNILCRN